MVNRVVRGPRTWAGRMHPGRLIAFMARHLRGLAASTTRYAPTSTRGSSDSGARAGPSSGCRHQRHTPGPHRSDRERRVHTDPAMPRRV